MNCYVGIVVLLFAIGCVFGATNDTSMDPPPGPPITPSSSPAPIHPTSPKPTSPKPTSPKPTSPPTSPSPTTSAKPPTSPPPTLPPTTTPKPPPTPSPPTTPTAAPTTTPAPKPTPGAPEIGDWNVTVAGTNNTCILVKMAVQIELTYPVKNGTTETFITNVPKNAEAEGSCGDKIQNLSITWQKNNKTNIMKLTFSVNTTTSETSLSDLGLVLNEPNVFNATAPFVLTYNKTEFNVPRNKSYKCSREEDIKLNPVAFNATAVLKVSHVQVQAFKNVTHVGYDDAIDCMNSTPDIVPIAVGCALAALVVIVLLAYLYGRRRSQARGYLSM